MFIVSSPLYLVESHTPIIMFPLYLSLAYSIFDWTNLQNHSTACSKQTFIHSRRSRPSLSDAITASMQTPPWRRTRYCTLIQTLKFINRRQGLFRHWLHMRRYHYRTTYLLLWTVAKCPNKLDVSEFGVTAIKYETLEGARSCSGHMVKHIKRTKFISSRWSSLQRQQLQYSVSTTTEPL